LRNYEAPLNCKTSRPKRLQVNYGSDYAELLQVEDELAKIARNQRNMAKA
jgi:hypothetical protein